MAYLEAAIVVYLRELFYPNGFHFPLIGIPSKILIIEIGREAATILMLYVYARSISQNGREILGYFSINFGIWDIWYYLWLKILLNWPDSIFDKDILFLIPLPWVGPVIAPVLVSVALIGSGYIFLHFDYQKNPIKLTKIDWILELFSGTIIILSFLSRPDGQQFVLNSEIFPWWIFLFGLCLGIVVFVRRVAKQIKILS